MEINYLHFPFDSPLIVNEYKTETDRISLFLLIHSFALISLIAIHNWAREDSLSPDPFGPPTVGPLGHRCPLVAS